MGCLENLPYEVILSHVSFAESRKYLRKNYMETYDVKPGYGIFDVHLIGVPPITIAIDGDDVIFPFTKPCHGTFLVRVKGGKDEIERLRREQLRKRK